MTESVARRRKLNEYANLLIGSTFFLFVVSFPIGALAILAGASVTFTGYTIIMLLNRDKLGGNIEEREPLIRNLHKALGYFGVATLTFIFIPIADYSYQANTGQPLNDFILVAPAAVLVVIGLAIFWLRLFLS